MRWEAWHKWAPMVPDEIAEDSPEESIDPPEDRTDQVAALSPDEAQAHLEDEADDLDAEDDLDNQPTKKMGALSAEEAAKVAAATGKRRSIRVFKHPSSPPPRLELPLATAQHQAVGIESAAQASAPSGGGTRVKVAVATLTVAFLVGGLVAWATHTPYVTTTPLTPRPSSQAPSPTPAEQAAQTPQPSVAMVEPPSDEATSEGEGEAQEVAELSGPERAEALLEEAEGLRGNALRSALEEAASADPSNPHAASALAEFHMESDPHEALEWALQASQLRRRRASYRELVADAYERIGNLNDAARARAAAQALRAGD